MELKRIDFVKNEFVANGKLYKIVSRLPISRYCEFQVLQVELAMGMTVQKLYDKLSILRQVLNQARFVDSAILIGDMTSHMAKLVEKEPTVLKICTLFINTEDEDITTWNNDLVVRKLADWKAEGICADDFFRVAFNTAPGYIEIYNTLTLAITETIEKAKAGLNAKPEEK